MAGSGSTTYVDGDGAQIVLGSLRLILIDLDLPRVAFVSPAPGSVLVSFAVDNRKPPLVLDGLAMARDEILVHGLGEAFHARSDGPRTLGFVAISQRDFARYTRALLGRDVELALSARFLHLPAMALRNIRRLHAQAFHLHAAKPALLARREVARALEQDLIHALLGGVGAAEPRCGPQPNPRHVEIVARFEEILGAPGRLPSLAELCAALDVPERMLRHCCQAFLGCGPMAYARLRRSTVDKRFSCPGC
jgi:hypothetical protein